MTDRYFIEAPIIGDCARLIGTEAHHLAHVMRGKQGDEIVLFDGGGSECIARVERIGRAEIELAVLSRQQIDRELRPAVTLGVALPKADRARWLVEKSVELGVSQLVPLASEHSMDRLTPSALGRLRRAVIEASKQCGRNRLMEIFEPAQLADYLTATPPGTARLFAHPEAASCASVLPALLGQKTADQPVLLAVGPEGGFSPAEVQLAQSAGWQLLSFGPRILRVETAALALVAAVAMRWQPNSAGE
jgi:16S rRNA (uracil1498-N3)-methyltransferase